MAKTKLITIGLAAFMTACMLAGCSNIKYNAKLFDNAVEWVNEDFADNNLVDMEGATNPFDRTFIIMDQEEYNRIFVKNIDEFAIDFDSQMVVVYTFSTIYHRDNRLVDLDVEKSVLKITYKMQEKSGVGDASQPYQRWFVVILDKLNVNSVVFEEKN